MLQEWSTAIIYLIYKQGDKLECHNYRGISLLNVTYKICTNLLTWYIEPYVEGILGDYQCGFRKGKSTTDQIFCLRMILQRTCEYKIDIHQLYIDYKQAYTINTAEAGAMITSLNDIETEIKSKTAVGNKWYYALGTILKRRSISQLIKIRLYKTIIRPVVTYGAETGTVGPQGPPPPPPCTGRALDRSRGPANSL
jgi:hypothetical protein